VGFLKGEPLGGELCGGEGPDGQTVAETGKGGRARRGQGRYGERGTVGIRKKTCNGGGEAGRYIPS